MPAAPGRGDIVHLQFDPSSGREIQGPRFGLVLSGQGAVHCHQLKSLDWRARRVRIKEAAPQAVVDEVLARIEAILFD